MKAYEQQTVVVRASDTLCGDAIDPLQAAGSAGGPPGIESVMEGRLETRTDRGTRRGALALCSVCGFMFPVREMTRNNGRWYCRRLGCADDTRKGG